MLDWTSEIVASYGLAAVAAVLLGVHTALPGSSRFLPRSRFAIAVAVLCWSVFGGYSGAGASFAFSTGHLFFELAFLLAWFSLCYRLLRGPYRKSMPEVVRRGLYLFWGAVLIAAVLFSTIVPAADTVLVALPLAGSLVLAALAAQLQRDAPLDGKPALRAFVWATGLVTFAQVVTYAAVLMSVELSSGQAALRAIPVALGTLLVMQASRLRPQWSLAIFVSPQSRAYAPRLLGMALVFALCLFAAPAVRSVADESSRGLAALLLLGAALPIAILLFSERLSAQLKVFVSKHFLPFRYDYREEWLRLIDTLASPDQRLPLPERTIQAVAQIVGSPAGVLWLRRGDDVFFQSAAHWNTRAWPDSSVPVDDPVLNFMHERQWILDTAELRRDPAMYEGLARPGWLERFPDALLVVPLISNDNLLGFMVLFQSSSAFRLTFEEIDLLRTSGRQVAAYLAQYLADQQLAESQQFEAFNRLTAFVMHDLKNLIAQQSLVVKNAARHRDNPDFFEDAIATIDNSVGRMSRLLKQLQGGGAAGAQEHVKVAKAVEDAIQRVDGRKPQPTLQATDLDLGVRIDRERFVTVLAHLLRNAQDAVSGEGAVEIEIRSSSDQVHVVIIDNGSGMDPEFVRTRLFRPFDSTKGSQGMGIGVYQAKTLALDAGGSLEVWSEPGEGSRFTIRLPADRSGSKKPGESQEPAAVV